MIPTASCSTEVIVVTIGVSNACTKHEADGVSDSEGLLNSELVIPTGWSDSATAEGVVGFPCKINEAEATCDFKTTLTESLTTGTGTAVLRIDVMSVSKSYVKTCEGSDRCICIQVNVPV